MKRLPLVARRILDPRPVQAAAASPLHDAVNIPFDEIAACTHELPPRGLPILIADVGQPAKTAQTVLRELGRSSSLVEPVPVDPTAPPEVGRLWSPNPSLIDWSPRLDPPPGATALDVACGTGRDTVFLASLGWEVTGVDLLESALERAARLSDRCAAALAPPKWIVADMERDPPEWESSFDLIVQFRFLHRPLVPALRRYLRPGGRLIVETYTTLHSQRHGRPSRSAHLLLPGELPDLLAPLQIEHFDEAWRGSDHTARAIARRGEEELPQSD